MLISKNLHKKSKVSIKTRSSPASLSFIGQVTRHTTVKWTIQSLDLNIENMNVKSLNFWLMKHYIMPLVALYYTSCSFAFHCSSIYPAIEVLHGSHVAWQEQ